MCVHTCLCGVRERETETRCAHFLLTKLLYELPDLFQGGERTTARERSARVCAIIALCVCVRVHTCVCPYTVAVFDSGLPMSSCFFKLSPAAASSLPETLLILSAHVPQGRFVSTVYTGLAEVMKNTYLQRIHGYTSTNFHLMKLCTQYCKIMYQMKHFILV